MRPGQKRETDDNAIGRSRGGLTTKIHAAVNEHGQLVRFRLTGGHRHDMTEAENLLHGLNPRYVIADKGYDSNVLRQQIRRQKAKPVIPARKNTHYHRYDKAKYKLRNVIERFFNRVKHYRRVATRYDKTYRNYVGFVCLSAIVATIL